MDTSGFSLFDKTFAGLQQIGPFKTWSLIVTIFGDMAPRRDVVIDSQLLGRLCAPFGVRPEALRVALHRLRKDGWLEAERKGRRSAYRLSETGQTATAEAAQRIYAEPCRIGENWCIAPVESSAMSLEFVTPSALAIGPNLLAHVAGKDAPKLSLVCSFSDVPHWMKAKATASTNSGAFAPYQAVVAMLSHELEVVRPDLYERVALRLAVLHYWRRNLLRCPDVAERLLGPEWEGFEARKTTLEVFSQLGRPGLSELVDDEAA